MRYEVRAMSFGEILDTGFRLVRNHFKVLVGTAAVLYVPTALWTGSVTSVQNTEMSGALLLGIFSFALALIVVSPVVSAAITHAVGEVYLGRTVTVAQCLRFGFSIIMPLAGTTLLAGLAIMGAFLLTGIPIGIAIMVPEMTALAIVLGIVLIMPGTYLILAYMLIWQVMVLEHSFGMAALRRSRDLMRGNLLRGFGVLFVAALIYAVVVGAIQLVLGYVPLVGPIGSGLAQAVGGAYTTAVSVVLYFDIRCRKEAFEIDHLAQLVGAQASAAPATAAPGNGPPH